VTQKSEDQLATEIAAYLQKIMDEHGYAVVGCPECQSLHLEPLEPSDHGMWSYETQGGLVGLAERDGATRLQ
jgi:hypothetical protein